MKVQITKPTHILVEPCVVEVNEAEAKRLLLLGVAKNVVEVKEKPIVKAIEETEKPTITKEKKETRKAKK